MTLGEKIQKERKEAGLSQEDLAEQLGVSRQAVSRWERDNGYPETEKIVRIGQIFQVSLDYLLGEDHAGAEAEEKGFYVSREHAEGFLNYQKVKYQKICSVLALLGVFGGLPYFMFKDEVVYNIISTIILIISIIFIISIKITDNPYSKIWKEQLIFDNEVLKQIRIKYAESKQKYKWTMIVGAGILLAGFLLAPDLEFLLPEGLKEIAYISGSIITGIGACIFIYARGRRRAYRVLVYNEEYHNKKRK